MSAAHQATTAGEDLLDLFRSPQSPSDLEKRRRGLCRRMADVVTVGWKMVIPG